MARRQDYVPFETRDGEGMRLAMMVLGLCFTDGSGPHFSQNPFLVALSFAVAALGSFAALDLAERGRCNQHATVPWQLFSSLTLGGSIWAMHFLGMLAVESPIPLTFAPSDTLASLAIAIAGTALGFRLVVRGHADWRRVLLGGGVVGAAVATMHYVGMAGLRFPGSISYTPGLWLLSVSIGIVAASAALALAIMPTSGLQRAAAAPVMAMAICGMHYTGMAATIVRYDPAAVAGRGVNTTLLAVAVGGIAAVLLMLVTASAAADRKLAAAAEREVTVLRRANALLERTQHEIIRRLCAAGECRDDDTGQHVTRISALAHRLVLASGGDPGFARQILAAAPLHDIGKIGVPDAILHKPGRLTEPEITEMRRHAYFGARILAGSGLPLLELAAEIARSHHENWDGSGYPAGLAGERIPLAGRIVAIVDVFDALLSPRVYKKAWSLSEVVAFLRAQSGRRFDPNLLAAFLSDLDTMVAIWRRHKDSAGQHTPAPAVRAPGIMPHPAIPHVAIPLAIMPPVPQGA